MKISQAILVAIVASFISLVFGATPNCGSNGTPDAYARSMCSCYSGYAPSSAASTDCNVYSNCPAFEAGDAVGQYGADRPSTNFANDRLEIVQTLPIVQNRLGTQIRLVSPSGIPGVTAGTMGAQTCGYPGKLWTKTTNSNSCKDQFSGSIPWNSNAMCGFVVDSSASNSTDLIYKATLLTQYNESFIGWDQREQLRVQTNTYILAVRFLQRVTISSILINMTLVSASDVITLSGSASSGSTNSGTNSASGASGSNSGANGTPQRGPVEAIFDTNAGTVTLTIRTSTLWPYEIDGSSTHPAGNSASANGTSGTGIVSSYPVGATVSIIEDVTVTLSCPNTPRSSCSQQFIIVIARGNNCDVSGDYHFIAPFTCRDGGPCPSPSTGSFSFSLDHVDFCANTNVDASANNAYALEAYQDVALVTPATTFSLGATVFFDLSVVNPSTTLFGITFSDIRLVNTATGNSDILYSTSSGTTAVTGVGLHLQEVNSIVDPGVTSDLKFNFNLMSPQLPNTLLLATANNAASVRVEVVINLVYYNNQKREVKMEMEIQEFAQGGASTVIQVKPKSSSNLKSDSSVNSIPTLFALTLLSLALLF